MFFYHKYILPKILDSTMKRGELERYRAGVVSESVGVVLEVGFGSGLNLPYYKKLDKLLALDPSQESYDLAKKRIDNVSFPVEYLPASAEKIPLGDNTIDTVVSTWSLCSIPHPESALKEMLRVLKPDGKFMFIEHGKSPKKSTFWWQKFLTPVWKRVSGNCHLDREIDNLIRTAGFEIQKIDKFTEKTPLMYSYKGVARARKN